MDSTLMQAFDPSELDRFLSENPDIEAIEAAFVDLCGVVRGKRFPRAQAQKLTHRGMTIAQAIFALNPLGAPLDGGGHGITDGDPDGFAVPVSDSIGRLPWTAKPTAQILMSLVTEDGSPVPIVPRNVLARVLDKFRETGLTPVSAFELEFYLIDQTRGNDGQPRLPQPGGPFALQAAQRTSGTSVLDSFAAVLGDVEAYAAALNLPTGAICGESGLSQFEINLHHVDDPLTAADHAALLRHAVKKAAEKHGLHATFMAKPFPDEPGNGMHVHLSLVDASGRNVFAEDESALGHALGGLQRLFAESMAIFAPNINSYRRYVPGNFTPVNRSWGHDNRSVAFRIPAGAATARRIEHRVAGADANPYLTMAAILAAVHHGLTHRLDPSTASVGNANLTPDSELPRSLLHALDTMAASERLGGYLGKDYLDFYVDLKRKELEMFMSLYSRQEYEWYL